MKITLKKETLLKPLQTVIGVVERKHTMPILSNILLHLHEGTLTLTATDLEIELIGKITDIESHSGDGKMTLPGRKLFDIVRSLQDNALVTLSLGKNQKVTIESLKSKFTLSSFNSDEFPMVDSQLGEQHVMILEKDFLFLLKRTAFAMAHQDVRYFLNGMLLELDSQHLKVVATDGHRLAVSSLPLKSEVQLMQLILPRKAVLELLRLLSDREVQLTMTLGHTHVRFQMDQLTFTTKLLDGRYPDYHRVIPKESNHLVTIDQEAFKSALSRAAILSNEKFRGVRLQFSNHQLMISANNPEREEAQEELDIAYEGAAIDIGFNVGYLLDILNVIDAQKIQFSLGSGNASALIREHFETDATPVSHQSLFVVMPVRI